MINFLQLLFMILLICISCGGNRRSLRTTLLQHFRLTHAHAKRARTRDSKTNLIVKSGTRAAGKYATRVARYAECLRRAIFKKRIFVFCYSHFTKWRFFAFFLKNIWLIQKKVVPLQQISKRDHK